MIKNHTIPPYAHSDFINTFDKSSIIINAPGRINLIGEHTDYNGGLVLPAAIDKSIVFVARLNKSNSINIHSLDYDRTIKIDLNDVRQNNGGTWADYIIGILHKLIGNGAILAGFDCSIKSNIPIGAGLSSSAALCCGFIKTISELNEFRFSNWKIVHLAQEVENNFIGVKSGFMDQFASVFGQADRAFLLNCRSKEFREVEVALGDYEFVLIDSQVKHAHTHSGYNTRPEECADALHVLNNSYRAIHTISDVNIEELSAINKLLDPLLFNRVSYVVEENNRVALACDFLLKGSVKGFGHILYESHNGLKDKYQVSCEELDFLVEQTKNIAEVAGARMMGGGFGGCTLNLIKKGSGDILNKISKEYQTTYNIVPSVYKVTLGEGVKIIKNM